MELESQRLKREIIQWESQGEQTIADMLRNKLRIVLDREEYLRREELMNEN